MKLLRWFVVLAITSSAAVSCSSSGIESNEYFVQNVVDGDTIQLSNGRKVRYIGIDTPETMKPQGGSWIYDPEEFGPEAMNFNKALVLGKKVRLEFDVVKEDKYNRWLAYVYIDDGIMANREVIRNGYSMLYTIPPNVKHMDLLLKAQEEARVERKGLWGSLDAISADSAKDYIGKWKKIKGRVVYISLSPYKIYIRFDYDPKTSLSAVIYGKNLMFFTKKGIDPAVDYKDKTVEVVGKIEEKKGLEIVIDNPSQIRIVE